MDIRKSLLPIAYMVLLFNCASSASAALPEACFASKYDYDLFTKYGSDGRPYPDKIDWDNTTFAEMDEYEKGIREAQYGSPKRKAVSISVKQSQASSGAKIIADASSSTTPSGKKKFTWGSANVVSTTAEYSSKGGSPGSYSNIQLTVEDPVCDISDSTQVRMTSK